MEVEATPVMLAAISLEPLAVSPMDRDISLVVAVPTDVMTPALLRDVFDVHCRVLPDPDTGRPLVVPLNRC